MLALTILLALVGVGALVAMIVNFAVFALPLYVAVLAGRFAFETGAGYLGAFLVGAAAGGVALGLGQIAFAALRWWPARIAVALVFAVPAGIAGYSVTHGLLGLGIDAEGWRHALALVGAGATALAAMAQLGAPAPGGRLPPEGSLRDRHGLRLPRFGGGGAASVVAISSGSTSAI